MATGLQQPLFCQDLLYPASELRELVASLGSTAGVISGPSYKVSAGSGLQVNVSSGAALVEQANGPLYYQTCATTVTPSNSVVVSSVNPQIAQIILRIYDVNELKITGSSNAKIEWLNGTPTASATEAKMKEGKYEGATVLPESSLRLYRILVPKNAASSASYYIEDARVFSNSFVRTETTSPSYLSWGRVTESGEIKAGSGDYTLKEAAGGSFKFFWNKEKPNNLYGVTATPISVTNGTAISNNIEKASFEVLTRVSSSFTASPQSFSFVVLGSS